MPDLFAVLADVLGLKEEPAAAAAAGEPRKEQGRGSYPEPPEISEDYFKGTYGQLLRRQQAEADEPG